MILAEFPSTMTQLNIYPIFDVHIGAGEHDEELFGEYLKQIMDDPFGYAILGGDIIDNATKNSVGSVYGARLSPVEQKRRAATLLTPIRDKIICAVNGNHEERTMRESGQDITLDICSKLDIEDRYRDNQAFCKISLGKCSAGKRVTYILLASHGAGGGGTIGAAMNRTENYLTGGTEGVDIFVTGHVHKIGVSRPQKLVVDPRNNKVTERDMLNVVCGAWQRYGGYAARMLLKPGGVGAPRITLSGRKKEFHAVV